MAKKKRFFVLGSKASMFYDPVSKVKVMSQTEPVEFTVADTMRLKLALSHGHIKVLSPDEVEAHLGRVEKKVEESAEVDLSKMKKDQLIKYFKEKFDYNDEQLSDFEGMKRDEMIAYIEEELE